MKFDKIELMLTMNIKSVPRKISMESVSMKIKEIGKKEKPQVSKIANICATVIFVRCKFISE